MKKILAGMEDFLAITSSKHKLKKLRRENRGRIERLEAVLEFAEYAYNDHTQGLMGSTTLPLCCLQGAHLFTDRLICEGATIIPETTRTALASGHIEGIFQLLTGKTIQSRALLDIENAAYRKPKSQDAHQRYFETMRKTYEVVAENLAKPASVRALFNQPDATALELYKRVLQAEKELRDAKSNFQARERMMNQEILALQARAVRNGHDARGLPPTIGNPGDFLVDNYFEIMFALCAIGVITLAVGLIGIFLFP